jgi:hypothetical protein
LPLRPAVLEDARATVLRLRTEARLVDEAGPDALTGAHSRRVLVRRLSGQRAGDDALRVFGGVPPRVPRRLGARGRGTHRAHP